MSSTLPEQVNRFKGTPIDKMDRWWNGNSGRVMSWADGSFRYFGHVRDDGKILTLDYAKPCANDPELCWEAPNYAFVNSFKSGWYLDYMPPN